ncbi:MAG TPA: HDOD domain-containing protein, partial [Candidatus Tenderia electrophaga]|nr:HDOD domain-containing protein [Candidatus Tenderia electrophaga]
MPELLIARQPIYNRTQHVFGYELLYQPGKDSKQISVGDEAPAAQVILDALTEIGIDNLVGQRQAFVRLSRDFISGKYPLPLPQGRLVIDVAADMAVDAGVIDGIEFFVKQGYTIAIGSYTYSEASLPLLALVNIIKLDIQALSEEELRYHVNLLQEYQHLSLLADNIEIPDEYEVCRELGFDYFQGHFFSRPKLVRRTRMPSNQLALMRLLAEVQRPDTNIPKLEAMISQDVGLSYKLLRYINSAFFGLPKPVDSIQRAVVFLGTHVIQKWTTLLLLSRVDDKPAELMITAVVRAKMCEILAKAVEYENEDTCF